MSPNDDPPGATGSSSAPGATSKDPVTGWKNIATFIGESVKTAQRFAARDRDDPLPVMRGRRQPVKAWPAELQAWLDRRNARQQDEFAVRQAAEASKMLSPLPRAIPAHHVLITIDCRRSAITSTCASQLRQAGGGRCEPLLNEAASLLPAEAAKVEKAFAAKNRGRVDAGCRPEEAEVPLLRLVSQPNVIGDHLDLIVAPVAWDLYSVTKRLPDDPKMEPPIYEAEESLLRAVHGFLRRAFPAKEHDDAPRDRTTPRQLVPLGIEGLVLTTDGCVLLRRKDRCGTVGGGRWDVSFSGYARFAEEFGVTFTHSEAQDIELDVPVWAAREFARETGAEPSKLLKESLRVFGVHRNTRSGATDLLCAGRTTLTSADLLECMHLKASLARAEQRERKATGRPWTKERREEERARALEEFRQRPVAPDTRGAIEFSVHGNLNVFQPFTRDALEAFVSAVKGESWLPEATTLLEMALKSAW